MLAYYDAEHLQPPNSASRWYGSRPPHSVRLDPPRHAFGRLKSFPAKPKPLHRNIPFVSADGCRCDPDKHRLADVPPPQLRVEIQCGVRVLPGSCLQSNRASEKEILGERVHDFPVACRYLEKFQQCPSALELLDASAQMRLSELPNEDLWKGRHQRVQKIQFQIFRPQPGVLHSLRYR